MVVVLVPMGHGSDGPMVMGLGYGAVFLMDCGFDSPMVVDLVGGGDGRVFVFFLAVVCGGGWMWWLWYGWWVFGGWLNGGFCGDC